MKSAEECFIEIVEFVKDKKKECLKRKDNNERIITSSILFCDRKFFDGEYVAEGFIEYSIDSSDVFLHFYFSNKRSYISIDKRGMTDMDVTRFQYNLLLLTAKLFGKYNIDHFVNNLLSNC